MIATVSLFHFGIGIALLATGAQLVASSFVLSWLIPQYEFRGVVYIVASVLPFFSVLWSSRWSFLFLWPQQSLLFLASASVLIALSAGHYTDMTYRPRGFIFVDQWIYLVVAMFHLKETVQWKARANNTA